MSVVETDVGLGVAYRVWLFRVLFLIAGLFPALLYSRYAISDSFSHFHAAVVTRYLQTPSPEILTAVKSVEGIPGFSAFYVILAEIIQVDPRTLQFFAVLGLVSPFVLFASAFSFSRSRLVGAFIAIALIYQFFAPYYSLWPHGIGWILFFLAMIPLHRLLVGGVDRRYALIIAIFGASIGLYSYTAQSWLLVMVLATAALLLFFRQRATSLRMETYLAVSIGLLAYTVFFSRVLYSDFLPKLVTSVEARSALVDFLARYGRFLPGFRSVAGAPGSPYDYASVAPGFVSWINLGIIVLSGLFAAVGVWWLVQSSRMTRSWIPLSLALGLVAVASADIVSYASYRIFSLRPVVPLALMILAVCYGHVRNRRKQIRIAIICLACLAMLSFNLNWDYGDRAKTQDFYEGVDHGALWVSAMAPGFGKILADHHTAGRIDLMLAYRGDYVSPVYYGPSIYEDLLRGGNLSRFGIDFVLLDLMHKDSRVLTMDWADLKALGEGAFRAPDFPGRNLVYDSAISRTIQIA